VLSEHKLVHTTVLYYYYCITRIGRNGAARAEIVRTQAQNADSRTLAQTDQRMRNRVLHKRPPPSTVRDRMKYKTNKLMATVNRDGKLSIANATSSPWFLSSLQYYHLVHIFLSNFLNISDISQFELQLELQSHSHMIEHVLNPFFVQLDIISHILSLPFLRNFTRSCFPLFFGREQKLLKCKKQ